MKMEIYVNFSGSCAQAFRYYEKHLGAQVGMMLTHAQSPEQSRVNPEWKDAILHARISIGGMELMAADMEMAVSYSTAREEFSITQRKAERLIAELVKLELVRKSEFQPEKNIVRYETTIQGNALALAKAGKPVSRASADRVLQEFLDRVKRVNEQSELNHPIDAKRSCTCPRRKAKNVSWIGIKTRPPSASAEKARSISALLSILRVR
jgi:PhnB protein